MRAYTHMQCIYVQRDKVPNLISHVLVWMFIIEKFAVVVGIVITGRAIFILNLWNITRCMQVSITVDMWMKSGNNKPTTTVAAPIIIILPTKINTTDINIQQHSYAVHTFVLLSTKCYTHTNATYIYMYVICMYVCYVRMFSSLAEKV